MRRKHKKDSRVKTKNFPFSMFVFVFIAFGLFTTIQMQIIGNYIDISNMSTIHVYVIVGLWIIAAITFTFVTVWEIDRHYQQPIEKFARAARKVASGDFSVYVAPRHTPDKADYLDVIFEDFNKMVEALGSVETLKTDFFSNVSHEIKTPLAVIQNNAELLKNDALSDEQRKEYTGNILHASKRLSGLITNMLKLNKLEKQVIKPKPAPYDVCSQLCDCALQFEDQWDKKDIEFVADMEDRAMITADAELLDLVWTNILSNAVKFTPDGGTITITQTSNEEKVVVSISDTGCGIDAETQKHIFDKFYQGDTSHSTEGNGLGLALVLRILELSDGTITVNSELGKGTTFTVTLPASMHSEGDINQ